MCVVMVVVFGKERQMGCLNSTGNFTHWFGNIHLSGPCNRACYFCIGQHMMALDSLNTLDSWPLPGIEDFIRTCRLHHVSEVNITGTNTDPLLYKHMGKLKALLKESIPGLVFGVRTNGALILKRLEIWELFDKGSISIPSLNRAIYKKMMGGGVPDLEGIMRLSKFTPKINVVLGPENAGDHLEAFLVELDRIGVKKVNLREPYGQPHVGNPLARERESRHVSGRRFGMPVYLFGNMEIMYWDVHYVEVESVNLYANGRISVDYPITRGHDEQTGKVLDQGNFKKSGRQQEQWLSGRRSVRGHGGGVRKTNRAD